MAIEACAVPFEVRQDLSASADGAFNVTAAPVGPVSIVCRGREATGIYRSFELSAPSGRDANGRAGRWQGFASDIDANTQMTEALGRSEVALEKASQMSTVAEVSASIAHEINQPLSAIVTNTAACDRWLSAATPNIARARLAMDRVARDARSISAVVERVRALYRYGPLSRSEVDLSVLARETLELMSSECERARVSVSLDLADALPTIGCDRIQINQVLTNLIRNAIEAMKASTTVARSIALSTGIGNAGQVVLAVSDTGPGFSNERRAFEAFYTTKEYGMGMGLAICRSIVEQHGGTIVARNLQPHGAYVEMILPTAPAPADDRGTGC